MRHWFWQLHPRRQLTVTVIAFLGLVLVLVVAVFLPLHERARQLRLDTAALQGEVTRVNQLADRFQSLKSQVSSQGNEALSTRVTATLQDAALQANRMQVNPDGSLQLWFDDMAFNRLLDWLAAVESTPGLLLGTVDVTQTTDDRVRLSAVITPGE